MLKVKLSYFGETLFTGDGIYHGNITNNHSLWLKRRLLVTKQTGMRKKLNFSGTKSSPLAYFSAIFRPPQLLDANLNLQADFAAIRTPLPCGIFAHTA